MKKYLFVCIIALIAISITAFTMTKKRDEKKLTNYFWYNVSGGSISGTTLNPGGTVSKTTAMGTLTNCQDHANQPLCIVGSPFSNLNTGDPIPGDANDNYIRKTIP